MPHFKALAISLALFNIQGQKGFYRIPPLFEINAIRLLSNVLCWSYGKTMIKKKKRKKRKSTARVVGL